MNFLAHFLTASRAPAAPFPAFVVGSALPDLLPLAAPRIRLRPAALVGVSDVTPEDAALRAGVLSHLTADAAFHKTDAFAEAQAETRAVLEAAGFVGVRIRAFFLAHVFVELALDAALLRADSRVVKNFYAAFDLADFDAVTRWTEAVVTAPLPHLPFVLSRFSQSKYLRYYESDDGLAEGVNRLCARARQGIFEGENRTRLTAAAGKIVAIAARHQKKLLDIQPPTTSK